MSNPVRSAGRGDPFGPPADRCKLGRLILSIAASTPRWASEQDNDRRIDVADAQTAGARPNPDEFCPISRGGMVTFDPKFLTWDGPASRSDRQGVGRGGGKRDEWSGVCFMAPETLSAICPKARMTMIAFASARKVTLRMSTSRNATLLDDLLAFLRKTPDLSLGYDARRARLLAKLEAEVASLAPPCDPVIQEARERWATTPFIRIDPDERMIENDVDGSHWVRAWVRISHALPPRPDSPTRRRYEAAIAAMPERMRQIFLAHCVEDKSYETIATQFSIDLKTVQNEIAAALSQLAAVLERNE